MTDCTKAPLYQIPPSSAHAIDDNEVDMSAFLPWLLTQSKVHETRAISRVMCRALILLNRPIGISPLEKLVRLSLSRTLALLAFQNTCKHMQSACDLTPSRVTLPEADSTRKLCWSLQKRRVSSLRAATRTMPTEVFSFTIFTSSDSPWRYNPGEIPVLWIFLQLM